MILIKKILAEKLKKVDRLEVSFTQRPLAFTSLSTLTGASSISCSIIESVSFQWSATYPPLQWVARGYVR
jgi:hypothetical protein